MLCRSPVRRIAVEHENHRFEVRRDQVLLRFRQARAHEGDAGKAVLADLHAIEEAFDHDDGRLPCHAMQVEKLERLVEARRKFVARLRAIDRSSGVGDEFAVRVVDRDPEANHLPHLRGIPGPKKQGTDFSLKPVAVSPASEPARATPPAAEPGLTSDGEPGEVLSHHAEPADMPGDNGVTTRETGPGISPLSAATRAAMLEPLMIELASEPPPAEPGDDSIGPNIV